mgnify:CR=1 FL=1
MLQHGAGKLSKVHEEIKKHVLDKGKGLGKRATSARSSTIAAWSTPCWASRRSARRRRSIGKKPLTGEQVRWGIENLNLSDARLKELGFEGMLKPIKITLRRPRGRARGARAAVGRQGVESDFRLVHRQSGDHRAARQGRLGQVRRPRRRSSRATAPRRAERSRTRIPRAAGRRQSPPPAPRRPGADIRDRCLDEAVVSQPEQGRGQAVPLGQQHRGHLRPRHPGAQGRLARGARAAASSRCSAPTAPARRRRSKAISNLLRAERGEVTKGSIVFDGRARRSA